MRIVGVGAVCFIAGVLVGVLLGSRVAVPASPPSSVDLVEIPVAAPDAGPPDEPDAGPVDVDAGPRWVVETAHDEMRGTDTRFACITSHDDLQLPFPGRDAAMRFCLRDSPNMGRDAFFEISNGGGQVVCNGLRGCQIAARFDDEEVQTFRADPAAQGFRVVFIHDADGFARRVLQAHRFVAELEFYNAGRRQVHFDDVEGLDWDLPAPARH